MKDLREATYFLGKQILNDRPSDIMILSQQTYVERILKRFNMQYVLCKASIVKGDRFSKGQYPRNDIERYKMKTIPYSSVVGNLMYAKVCTSPDIAFVVSLLGRYLSDPDQSR